MAHRLFHCGQWRKPFRRVTITDIPKATALLYGKEIQLDEFFVELDVYEFHCPPCKASKGVESLYAWVGTYIDRRRGKTNLQKSPAKEEEQWATWMDDRATVEKPMGVLAVTGSERKHPFRYRPMIPVR